MSDDDKEFVCKSANLDSVFKKALSFYANNEQNRACLLIKEALETQDEEATQVNQDNLVCDISAEIIDQISKADPRWAQSNEKSKEISDSQGCVIIDNQLEEKRTLHEFFIELLQKTGVWEQLNAVTTSISPLPTKLVIAEHSEKLVASQKLREISSAFSELLDSAIKKVLRARQVSLDRQSHLTSQDLFYKEVTRVDEIFWTLVEMGEERFKKDVGQSNDSLNFILSITDVIISVFTEVLQYRKSNGSLYESESLINLYFVPWSSDEHVSGIREPLLKLFDLLVQSSGIEPPFHDLSDEKKYTLVGRKIFDLVDIILDSYQSQLAFMDKSNAKYALVKNAFQESRAKCLIPLMRLKQYDQAALLAEKYHDFDVLIRICEELNSQEQLQQYIQQFASDGFSEYLFEWYLKEGKQGKMMSTVSNNYKLGDFLLNHESLNWLHQIHLEEFSEASKTLKRLATMEQQYSERKKTLLSIGKLALISAGGQNFQDFDDDIRFLNYQTSLSDSLLAKNGLTRDSMRILSHQQLIDLLISGVQGPNENFDNFVKAFEVCEIAQRQLSTELAQSLMLKIWKQAFLMEP